MMTLKEAFFKVIIAEKNGEILFFACSVILAASTVKKAIPDFDFGYRFIILSAQLLGGGGKGGGEDVHDLVALFPCDYKGRLILRTFMR